MYTLAEIYEYLTTGVEPVISSSFLDPSSGPGATGKSTDEIYDAIKALFDEATATPGEVLDTVKFFSTDTDTWGATQGTMPYIGTKNYTPGTEDKTIDEGYHDGKGQVAGDADLTAENIRDGVQIFDITGTLKGHSGDAGAGDVLAGKTFSNDSGLSTGTMPDNGAVTITPGTSNKTIDEGYHNGNGQVAGDADLTAVNIRDGVQIFDITGTLKGHSGDAGAGDVLAGKTFSNDSGLSTGTMPDNGAVTITPGTSNKTIDEGYHNGSGQVAGDADLTAGNIRDGVQIFGATGTLKGASGNAGAGDVLTGKTFSNDSGSSTGTMTNNGAVTITPGTSNKTINAGYHNGSGQVAGDADLTAGNIKDGVQIFGATGTLKGASGNAGAGDVLTGKTFSNDSGSSTGTMTNNGAVTITPGTSNKTIDEGYHNGSGQVAGDADLTAGNIKDGVQIFGATGTLKGASGNAGAGDVLTGKTFSNDSGSSTGTMTDNGAVTITPGTSNKTINAGYHNGSGQVAGDADLTAGNIKDGVQIFGATGTLKGASGNAGAGDVLTGKTFSNDSGSSTGTMTDNGAVTITPGTSNKTINAGYHNGSGQVAGDADLTAVNIKDGVQIFGATGTLKGASGNAGAGDVLTGKTFSNDSGSSTGTMTDNGAVTITPGTSNKTINAGYHNGSGQVAGDADLTAGNIKDGVQIFGATGTLKGASGNAGAGDVLSGKTFSNDSGSSTGTMTDNGAVTITPGTSNKTIDAGYHNGSGAVSGDDDLKSENIKSGVDIFGVSGDSNVVDTSSGDAEAGDIATGKKAWVDGSEITGTAFIPAYPALVPETGQTSRYDMYTPKADDGGTDPPGVSLPSPRFTDNNDGTVTDNLTGLIWLQNANCPGEGRYWQTALNDIRQLNLDGKMNDNPCGDTSNPSDGGTHQTDWRLPTVREFLSLVNFEFRNVSNTAGTGACTSNCPFTNYSSDWYWSSTSVSSEYAYSPATTGVIAMREKTYYQYNVWAVRGGE